VVDPHESGGPIRTFRGGAWSAGSFYLRSAARYPGIFPQMSYDFAGFRVALGPVFVH